MLTSKTLISFFVTVTPGLALTISSWEKIAQRLPSASVTEPSVIDSLLKPGKPAFKNDRITFFRERNGWCPYSERVWLALEVKRIDYESILIDNMGSRPDWYSGTTPQIRWDDGRVQGESMTLVKELDNMGPEKLWPKGRESDVDDLIAAFQRSFPRSTRPSSRAAFLFKASGAPVARVDFEAALDATEECLSRFPQGPFFAGEALSAADICWAPFLERYAAQLPALHAGLSPRDSSRWPRLADWYSAMETDVACYSSRVQGDGQSWRKVLAMAGYGNAGSVPVGLSLEDGGDDFNGGTAESWASYAELRPWLAPTADQECAARLLRNRGPIIADAIRKGGAECETADVAMREVIGALLECETAVVPPSVDDLTPPARRLVLFLDDRICVPRDMGRSSACALRRLASNLS